MRSRLRWIIPLILILLIIGLYLYPGQRVSFGELYSRVDPEIFSSLVEFRQEYSLKSIEVGGIEWAYLSLGDGPETIIFLHGMTGAYDIWWQQMEALQDDYRVISVTYPAVNSLREMERGVMRILEVEGVDSFYVVGSSLGGYLAQYLVSLHPHGVLGAVFANTFPPNEIIAEKNRTIGVMLPYLPEWLVMNFLSDSMRESVYPASGHSELVLAFGLEQTNGRMSKAQTLGRFHCVVEPFEAPNTSGLGIPVMIIEAENDPLVELELREQLKDTYPSAEVITLNNGHFPYLSMPVDYTAYLEKFFGEIELR